MNSMKNKVRKPTKRRPQPISKNKKNNKLNKKKVLIMLIILILLVILLVKLLFKENKDTVETSTKEDTETTLNTDNKEVNIKTPKEITDWNLILVNYENPLPENFEVELANIDSTRQFDARAIKYLTNMINDMRKDGITDIWAQSTYRSVQRQQELYDESIKKYLLQGKTKEEAEKLTEDYINKPGTSEHNLGLAVDFNYVNNDFEDGKAFEWLKEHAEDYGFILRYRKDKEDITKVSYESWHWRYVGEEHAKEMNKLDMCLEEYIEYLKYQD